jgi:apolipoprotein N-acyltransferase
LALVALAYWLLPILGMGNSEYQMTAHGQPQIFQLAILGQQEEGLTTETSDIANTCDSAQLPISKLMSETIRTTKDMGKTDLVIWPPLESSENALSTDCRRLISDWVANSKTPILVTTVGQFTTPSNRQSITFNLFDTSKTVKIPSKLTTENLWLKMAGLESANGFGFLNTFNRQSESPARILTLSRGQRLGLLLHNEVLDTSFINLTNGQGIYAFIVFDEQAAGSLRSAYWKRAFHAFRSVEYRLPMVKIERQGGTFLIDQNGTLLVDAPRDRRGSIRRSVVLPLAPPVTLYASLRDWFLYLCGGICAAFAAIVLRRKMQPVSLYERHQDIRKPKARA